MQSSSPEQQAGQDSRSARRRLIRGTFAAPVALTLASGGAAAASLTCVAKRVQPGVATLPGDADTTQIWVRVPVWTLSPPGNNNDSVWISGGDIFALAKNTTTSFILQNEWWCLQAESNAKMNSLSGADTVSLTSNTKYTPNPSPPESGSGGGRRIAQASTTRLVAIRVNAAGDIIGVVGDGGTTGSGITQSCWTSFRRP